MVVVWIFFGIIVVNIEAIVVFVFCWFGYFWLELLVLV